MTWRSKKQPIVVRSSTEVEFQALALGICEGMWLTRICNELRIPIESSMKVLCDNQSTISIAKNPMHHEKTKHVEIDRHFIKEKIEENIVGLSHIPTGHQTTDILTKSLARKPFDHLVSKLRLFNIYNPT